MISPSPGQRIQITADGEWMVHISGPEAARIAVCAVSSHGAIFPFEGDHGGRWRATSLPSLGEPIEILAYMIDDRHGGFVNECYPVQIQLAGETYSFPKPDQQLAAVILAEVYTKSGARRMKVSNEGFTFGIDAYARTRNFREIEFPGRVARWNSRSPQDGDDGEPAPRRSPGGQGSGSGVIIAPNVVVTNAHVIEDGIKFELGRTKSKLVPLAVDQFHDLALLEGDVAGEPIPLRIGSALWLGEAVLASGYPLMEVLGADLKVTTGNVSGLIGGGGDISRFQFTAPIGSGSSGGAIVDESGNLVGITSASLAHGSMREFGKISENVNFGIRVALVHEMAAAAGCQLPGAPPSTSSDRRDVVHRLRNSVVSILVQT